MSGEQLPAVNTWVKLIEIILLICKMATKLHFIIGKQGPLAKCKSGSSQYYNNC